MGIINGFLVFLFSFVLSFTMIKLAPILGNIDKPDSNRKLNKSNIPTSGGFAFVLTWFIGLFYLLIFGSIASNLIIALLIGFVLLITGFLDDLFQLKASIRFSIQFLTVGTALYFLGGLHNIDFGFASLNSSWLFTSIALIGVIWLVNLYNFMDGIDGYASTQAVFMSLFLFVTAGAAYNLLLLAAVLGFLIWNWQPAKLFMGDTGSTVLGFIFGVLLIRYQNTGQLNLIAGLIPLTPFWFDATSTLFRRWRNGEKLSEAHKKHAYQRLVQSGFSHQKTVLYGMGLNIVFFALAYGAFKMPSFVLAYLGVAMLVAYIATRWVDKRMPFPKG